MHSFFSSRRAQDSEPAAVNVTDYDSASELCPEDSDENEESKEDKLKSARKLSRVVTTNATPTPKVKIRPWWKRTWRKRSRKKKKKKKKKKKTGNMKKGRKGKSTVSMRRHHHATFAHLIHDAFVRLKCSHVHPAGYNEQKILTNIERHYKLKLGKKFKVRLGLSVEKLLAQGLLIPAESQKIRPTYKPSEKFLTQFARLKVTDGAANRRFGQEIQKYGRSRSPGGRRKQRSRRGRSRSKGRKVVRRRKSRKRRKRRRRGRKKVKRRRKHRRRRRSTGKTRGKASKSRTSQKKKKKTYTSQKSIGGTITRWFWPDPEAKDDAQKAKAAKVDNKQLQYAPGPRKRKLSSRSPLPRRVKGVRYRKFNRIRIRERKNKSAYLGPASSKPAAETPKEKDLASLASLSKSLPQSSPYISNVVAEGLNDKMSTDEEMSDTTSLAEHDLLHSLRDSSGGFPSASARRSFLEKLGDTLLGAFGSKRTSTTSRDEGRAGPSRPRRLEPTASQRPPSEVGPSSASHKDSVSSRASARRKPITRRAQANLWKTAAACSGDGDPSLPISSRLASLLQE